MSLILPACARVTDRLGKKVQMSTKDYVALASVVKAVGSTGGDTGTLIAVVARLGSVFAADNPNYKHDVFVDACGLDYLADTCAVRGRMKYQIRDETAGLCFYEGDTAEEALAAFLLDGLRAHKKVLGEEAIVHFENGRPAELISGDGEKYHAVPVG